MWTAQVNFCNVQGTENVLKFSGSGLLRPLKFLEVPSKCRANPLAGLGGTQASRGAAHWQTGISTVTSLQLKNSYCLAFCKGIWEPQT